MAGAETTRILSLLAEYSIELDSCLFRLATFVNKDEVLVDLWKQFVRIVPLVLYPNSDDCLPIY